MSYLLRKVSFSKWEPNKEKKPEEFTADAITGCTRTSSNTLSVWVSNEMDFDSTECENLIVAIATTMTRPDPIDLVWLEETWLTENGIAIEKTLGQSKCESINNQHRDLIRIDHTGLAIIGAHIVDKMKTIDASKRIGKKKLIALMINKLTNDDIISFDDLNEKWQKEITKKMDRTGT